MANAILVSSSRKGYGYQGKRILALSRKLIGSLGKKSIGFEVNLVSDGEIRALNRRFLGKDRTTNVLSFAAARGLFRPDLKKNTRYLGEIFLAPDYIHSRKENLERLFIHGFLHLLGYTHDMKRDTIKMERLEDKLSKKLKI